MPPLIVCALAYFGFMFVCVYFSSTLEGMYTQLNRQPSGRLRVLIGLREWLPVWGTLLPVLLAAAVILWRRGWGGWQRLIPGARRYAAAVRNANFADQLALLSENGVPLVEGLPMAAGVTGDAALIAASDALSAALAQNEKLSADAEVLRPLPPLLRWAFTGDLGSDPLPEILRFAATTYRDRAERQAADWRFVLPAMIGALLGGAIVLAYGLSVFGPYVRLLEDLAS